MTNVNENKEVEKPAETVSPVERLIICELKQTCSACPSQWKAILDDGRMLYFRYRWGWLRIEVSEKQTDDVMDAVGGKEVFSCKIGDDLDGSLDQAVMEKLTSHIIQYPSGVE